MMSYQYRLARAHQDQLLQDARDAQIDKLAAQRQRRQVSALLADIVRAVECRVDALRQCLSASGLDVERAS
jgi:hypothetical protein